MPNNPNRKVEYWKYCHVCKYLKTKSCDPPCCTCLEHPTNLYSDKPVKFEPDEKKGKYE